MLFYKLYTHTNIYTILVILSMQKRLDLAVVASHQTTLSFFFLHHPQQLEAG